MNERVQRLRARSLASRPRISAERATLLTEFYQREQGKHSVPVMRALAFKHLCEHKTIWIGDDELIVGERGPYPKAVPTYPELTCHSIEDLDIFDLPPKLAHSILVVFHRMVERDLFKTLGLFFQTFLYLLGTLWLVILYVKSMYRSRDCLLYGAVSLSLSSGFDDI